MKGSPSADSVDLEKTFGNSLVKKVQVVNFPDKEFKLNLFIKPNIDIVSEDSTCVISYKLS